SRPRDSSGAFDLPGATAPAYRSLHAAAGRSLPRSPRRPDDRRVRRCRAHPPSEAETRPPDADGEVHDTGRARARGVRVPHPTRNPADFPQTIGGAPSPHEVTRFPPGIAVRLAPHQPVILNSHYINGSPTDPLTPQVVFNVTRARPGTIRHHAEQMTIGDYQISIPPLGTASLTGEWIAPFAMNVIQLSSHEHKRGTRVAIHLLSGGQDAGQIFENDDWNHPLRVLARDAHPHRARRRLPLHVRVEERRRSPGPLRGHDQRRDVLHGRLLLPRRRVGPAPAGAQLPAADERASLL